MSSSSDLRASLIERGFIVPNPEATRIVLPLNHLQVSHQLGMIDVYETRFEGPIVGYDRDGVSQGETGETWRLPPLKNQWAHDWSRRVAAGQPITRSRAGRFAFYGEVAEGGAS